VIRYTFGEEEPLAYLKVLTTNRQDVATDIAADTFLLTAGAPLAVEATLERYGREVPKTGRRAAQAIATQKASVAPPFRTRTSSAAR
jgi:hypothetical protein